MTIYKDVSYYGETHCEMCNETVHNHFDCPVCKLRASGMSIYGEIDEYETNFECEECKAEFEILSSQSGCLTIKHVTKE